VKKTAPIGPDRKGPLEARNGLLSPIRTSHSAVAMAHRSQVREILRELNRRSNELRAALRRGCPDDLVLQHLEPGGHVCSGFLSPLGRAVLPVASTEALGAPGRDAAPAWLGAQLAPAGHVASGFCWFGGAFGDGVCANAAPPSAADKSRLVRNFGIEPPPAIDPSTRYRRVPPPPYAAHGSGGYFLSASIR
jgi:hypothetical protein